MISQLKTDFFTLTVNKCKIFQIFWLIPILITIETSALPICRNSVMGKGALISIIDWHEPSITFQNMSTLTERSKGQNILSANASARLAQAKWLSKSKVHQDMEILLSEWDLNYATFNYSSSQMNRNKIPNGLSSEVMSTLVLASVMSLKTTGELLKQWDFEYANFNFSTTLAHRLGKKNAFTPELAALFVLAESVSHTPVKELIERWDYHYSKSQLVLTPNAIATLVLVSAISKKPLFSLMSLCQSTHRLYHANEKSEILRGSMTELTMAKLIFASYMTGKKLSDLINDWQVAFLEFSKSNPGLTGEILADLLVRK